MAPRLLRVERKKENCKDMMQQSSKGSFIFQMSTIFGRKCYIVIQKQVSEFDLFTLDDIDSAFQNVTRLTYSQNHYMSAKRHICHRTSKFFLPCNLSPSNCWYESWKPSCSCRSYTSQGSF